MVPLLQEVAQAQAESDSKQKKVEKYAVDLESLKHKISCTQDEYQSFIKLKGHCDSELRKANQLPDKAARQSRTVETLNTQLDAQHSKLQAQVDALDAAITKLQDETEQLETEHATIMVEVERAQYTTEAQDKSVSDVQKQFHLKQFEAEQILATQVGREPLTLGTAAKQHNAAQCNAAHEASCAVTQQLCSL
jgi:predicted  nucleic acid-binding Zn-ribbon protein